MRNILGDGLQGVNRCVFETRPLELWYDTTSHWYGIVMAVTPDIARLIDEIRDDRIRGAGELARQAARVLKATAERSQVDDEFLFLDELNEVGRFVVAYVSHYPLLVDDEEAEIIAFGAIVCRHGPLRVGQHGERDLLALSEVTHAGQVFPIEIDRQNRHAETIRLVLEGLTSCDCLETVWAVAVPQDEQRKLSGAEGIA